MNKLMHPLVARSESRLNEGLRLSHGQGSTIGNRLTQDIIGCDIAAAIGLKLFVQGRRRAW